MEYKEFNKLFKQELDKTNINLNEIQIEKFYKYMLLIQEWNEKINLTAILEPKDMIIKHFIDSLSVAPKIKSGSKIIDVGTGAGFPGIPLKIYDETLDITLMDSLNKRIIFLNEVALQLTFKDKIEIIHGRAEEMAQNPKYREQFDAAISRAVAPLNILLEYLVPFVKVNGKVIAMKGSNFEEEIDEAKNAFKILECQTEKIEKIILPEGCGERNIIEIKKCNTTKKIYPRKAVLQKRIHYKIYIMKLINEE